MKEKTDRHVIFTDYESCLFHEGTHYELFRKLGSHLGLPVFYYAISVRIEHK